MTALGEKTLLAHLTDDESIEALIREGLDDELIPTEDFRPLYHWALDYYLKGGLRQAPSVEAILSVWDQVLEDNEIDLAEPPGDTVEWAIEDLKSSWVFSQVSNFVKMFAQEARDAKGIERVEVVNDYATQLIRMTSKLESRSVAMDVRGGLSDRMLAYMDRASRPDEFRGMRFGLSEIDMHTYGIHPGELAIMAGGPKSGKSFALAWTALSEWRAGRSPVLFTLENSVDMTLDRIACLECGIDSRRWQRGECHTDEIDRIQDFFDRMRNSSVPLWVMQPDLGRRSFEAMVADAKVREGDSLIIDQLTFVELDDPRKQKHERIGDALHRLKGIISTGNNPMPCLLAHQVNREGVKAADKTGKLKMHHLAESAEVERTADWVFGLYASNDEKVAGLIKFEELASRRTELQSWMLNWIPSSGVIGVRNPI
jgi:replicative DNA helicase